MCLCALSPLQMVTMYDIKLSDRQPVIEPCVLGTPPHEPDMEATIAADTSLCVHAPFYLSLADKTQMRYLELDLKAIFKASR